MTQTAPAARPTGPASASPALRALQVLSVLSVLNLVFQYVTAGTLVGRGSSDALEGVHGTGAIVLHVLTGLTAIAAGLMWLREGAPIWPAILAAVVFVLSFVQAYYGMGSTLWIHVPGAIVLTIGSVWVAAWSFSGATRRARA